MLPEQEGAESASETGSVSDAESAVSGDADSLASPRSSGEAWADAQARLAPEPAPPPAGDGHAPSGTGGAMGQWNMLGVLEYVLRLCALEATEGVAHTDLQVECGERLAGVGGKGTEWREAVCQWVSELRGAVEWVQLCTSAGDTETRTPAAQTSTKPTVKGGCRWSWIPPQTHTESTHQSHAGRENPSWILWLAPRAGAGVVDAGNRKPVEATLPCLRRDECTPGSARDESSHPAHALQSCIGAGDQASIYTPPACGKRWASSSHSVRRRCSFQAIERAANPGHGQGASVSDYRPFHCEQLSFQRCTVLYISRRAFVENRALPLNCLAAAAYG